MDLAAYRQQIDSIDDSILRLLASRFEITREIGRQKSAEQWPAQDNAREEAQFHRFSQLAQELGLPETLILTLYRNIIDMVVHEHRLYASGKLDEDVTDG